MTAKAPSHLSSSEGVKPVMGEGAGIGDVAEHGMKKLRLGSHLVEEMRPICCITAKTPKWSRTQLEAARSLFLD